jgi:hypothetical protein
MRVRWTTDAAALLQHIVKRIRERRPFRRTGRCQNYLHGRGWVAKFSLSRAHRPGTEYPRTGVYAVAVHCRV